MYEHEQHNQEHGPTQQQDQGAGADEVQHSAPPQASPTVGDEVLNILADVEQKFDRLRDVQKHHEHELTSLNQRREMLDEAEKELDQELNKLVEQRDALEAQQEALAQQQQQLTAQREDVTQQHGELETQRQRLQQIEQTLEKQRQELQRSGDAAQQSQRELAQQQQQFKEYRRNTESELAEQQRALEQRREELQRRAEQQQQSDEALQQIEQELNEQQNRFAEQREQWDHQREQQEKELSDRADQLAQREKQLGELKRTVDTQQAQLESLQQQLQQRDTDLNERARKLEADHQRLEQEAGEARQREENAAQQIESIRHKLAQSQQDAEQLRTALNESDQARAQLQERAEQSGAQLQQVQQERAEAQQNVEQLQGVLESLSQQSQQQAHALSESEKRLTMAGEKLKHFAEILNEQAPQLERGAAAMATVDEQRRQIEQITKELAEARRAGNPEELRRKEHRITELTEALRQARGQIGSDNDAAELQLEIAELSRQNDELRAAFEEAQLAAKQAKQQLQQQAEGSSADHKRSPDHAHAIEALNAEHEHHLQTLQAEHQQALQQVQNKSSEQVRSLQEQLGKLKEALVESRQRASNSTDGGAGVAAMQKRISELEAQLATSVSESGDASKVQRDLQRKAQKINAVAQHLSRRRQRLNRARQLLRQRAVLSTDPSSHPDNSSPADREERTRQLRAIDQQRRELQEVRQFLSHSERELMRRWARPRAVSSVGWLVFLSLVAAVASWFATETFFPAPVTAAVTFSPQPENPGEFDAEDAVNWQRWHAEFVLSSEFQEALAKRCRDRGLEPYGDVGELAARLSRDMSLDLSEPKKLTVSLRGLDADKTELLLDMFASTLSLESSRNMGRRTDNAQAVPVGERKEDGRVRYATLHPTPPIQERLRYAGPIFGGIMAGLLLLIGILYLRLVRSKRVFEEEQALFREEPGEGELLAVH